MKQSDIVERLRGNYNDGINRKPSAIKLEAADEIERLRALIMETCNEIDELGFPSKAEEFKRRALEGK